MQPGKKLKNVTLSVQTVINKEVTPEAMTSAKL